MEKRDDSDKHASIDNHGTDLRPAGPARVHGERAADDTNAEPTAVAPLTPIATGTGTTGDVHDAAPMHDAQDRYGGWAWIIVAAVGAFVGITDIVARYRDAPTRALRATPAWLYIGVNVAASLIALKLILELNWTFERPEGQAALAQVLVAGFGALLFMRSALFPIKQDGEEKAIGPAKVLEAILHASDRGVDRIQAQVRARDIVALMENTSFERAAVELPVVALALMQNLSEDEQRILEEQVAQLRSADQEEVSNEGKCLALGLLLVEYVGNDVLKAAKEAVAEPIRLIHPPKPELEAVVAPAPGGGLSLPPPLIVGPIGSTGVSGMTGMGAASAMPGATGPIKVDGVATTGSLIPTDGAATSGIAGGGSGVPTDAAKATVGTTTWPWKTEAMFRPRRRCLVPRPFAPPLHQPAVWCAGYACWRGRKPCQAPR